MNPQRTSRLWPHRSARVVPSSPSSTPAPPQVTRIRLGGRRVWAWRPTALRLRSLFRSLLISYGALGVTLFILPGKQASGPVAVLILALTVAAVGVVLRPILAGFAALLGRFGALAFGFVSQAIILDVAVELAPNVGVHGLDEILLVSWVAAGVAATLNWILDAGNEDDFLTDLLYRAVRVARQPQSDASVDAARGGLLILQFDGVGQDLLRQAMTAGTAPTLTSWLRSRSHTLQGWHTGLPATTPAGQAVLLYGNESEVPAFRWWEKESGRLLVMNHPRDATEVQRRLSDGQGLLADGGVSVSNLFSGDAPTTLLTMSDARLPPRASSGYPAFVTYGGGLVRSIVVAAGQVITELYQGQRQRHHNVEPRVHRGVVFAIQRAVTTALLRDLSVALVTEQIARAAPVIYADWTDYDEVAHHAGPSRIESMQALEGLDRLASYFAEVIRATGRHYEIVVVSDHGQSQGATFAQRRGVTLDGLVRTLTGDTAVGTDAAGSADGRGEPRPAEPWGSVNLFLTGVARSRGRVARAMIKVGTRNEVGPEVEVTVGKRPPTDTTAPVDSPAPVVAASGSLAHIYLRQVPGRVVREEIDRHYPALIGGLARDPAVGAVMVRSSSLNALVVVGADGWRILTAEGAVAGEGADPIAVYGPQAADDLRALDGRRHVGDIIVVGRFDPTTGEVAAFEELVGSHGGLGGGQNSALILHPTSWSTPTWPLRGLDVHQLLRDHLVPTGKRDTT
jgi:hypothetical protein